MALKKKVFLAPTPCLVALSKFAPADAIIFSRVSTTLIASVWSYFASLSNTRFWFVSMTDSQERCVFVILSSLALVDCAITITRRIALSADGFVIHKSAVLLFNEVLKFTFSLLQVVRTSMKKQEFSLQKYTTYFLRGACQLAPICLLYLLANLVSYAALQRVPASVFAAISQLKVLTTAFFTVAFLRNNISMRRWRTLAVMTLAVMIVTLCSKPLDQHIMKELNGSHTIEILSNSTSYFCGAALAFLQTVFTGFACVFLELRLKQIALSSGAHGSSIVQDIWDRNLQLSACSILIYFPLALLETSGNITRDWSPMATLISVLHAVGGILVALSIVHASSISKTVAVCAGLTLTSLLGGTYGDSHPNSLCLLACAIVALAILGYRDDVDLELSTNTKRLRVPSK